MGKFTILIDGFRLHTFSSPVQVPSHDAFVVKNTHIKLCIGIGWDIKSSAWNFPQMKQFVLWHMHPEPV